MVLGCRGSWGFVAPGVIWATQAREEHEPLWSRLTPLGLRIVQLSMLPAYVTRRQGEASLTARDRDVLGIAVLIRPVLDCFLL